jgi:hypothetical protein
MSNSNSFANGNSHSLDIGTEKEVAIWRWFGSDTRWQH